MNGWMDGWMNIERKKNEYAIASGNNHILETKPHTCDFEDTHYVRSQKEKIERDKNENRNAVHGSKGKAECVCERKKWF